jgi:protein phosphatase
MLKLKFYGKSVTGKDHENNEDSFLCNKIKRLFAVADGVTNYPGGKEASSLAINYLDKFFEKDLEEAVYKANLRILKDKSNNPNIGYTTLTAVHIKDKLIFVYVGDSSVFIIRGNIIRKLTTPNTKTVGMENLELKSGDVELKPKDFILLCTDGITSVLSESEILEVFYYKKSPRKIAEELIKGADCKFQHYNDDKTAIVIRVL